MHRWRFRGYLMSKLILHFIKNESGVTAIEYALISAGITFVIIAAANNLGGSLTGTFTAIATGMAG